MLHQANDEADSSASQSNSSQSNANGSSVKQSNASQSNVSQSSKAAQDQDKNAQQAAAAPVPVAVPVVKQPAPSLGSLTWSSGTAAKSGTSASPTEDESASDSDDEKKPQTDSGTSGAAVLMQAIAGLGLPQFTQPAPIQAASVQSGRAVPNTEVRATGPAPSQGKLALDFSSSPSLSKSDVDSSGEETGQKPATVLPPETDTNSVASSSQLAFAVRLNPDTAAEQMAPQIQAPQSQSQASHAQSAPDNIQTSVAAASDAVQPSAAVSEVVQNAAEQSGEHTERADAQIQATPSGSVEQFATARADTAHAIDQPVSVRSADVDQTPAPSANNTIRDVRLQVTGSDDQRVDVRVMDRGGELRVSVRADDPSLVRSLQDNVADLSTRLDQAHFQSEVWTPRTQAISQTDSASTNGRTFSNGGETSGGSGQGQQQNGRQQQQPAWMDDFDETPAGRNSGGTLPWQP
jgi:hypothetical protein